MKKILMVLTEFPPSIGGMQTHAILLSKRLYEKGMNIEVFTYRAHEKYAECAEVDKGFPFPIHRKLSRISYFYSLRVLTKAVKTFKPDFVYCSNIFYGVLNKLTGVKTICRSVGNDILRPWIIYPFKFGSQLVSNYFLENSLYHFFQKMKRPELVEILFRQKRLKLAVESAKSSEIILANSDYTKKMLHKNGISEDNIEILVGGVDADYFNMPSELKKDELKEELNIPKNRYLMLTACRIVDKKGVDFLITTLSDWHKNKLIDKLCIGKELHLVIVGDGRRFNKFKALAIELGINDFITFTGAVSYKEMPKYYWISDLFVLASTVFKDPVTGLFDAETMGRVLCEANASGIPVIATNSGGIPSVIKDGFNGLLFSENNASEFFEKLQKITNDDFSKKLIENGKKLASQKFDWEHILKVHEKYF